MPMEDDRASRREGKDGLKDQDDHHHGEETQDHGKVHNRTLEEDWENTRRRGVNARTVENAETEYTECYDRSL